MDALNVYDKMTVDLTTVVDVDVKQSKKIVDFLRREGFIDYNQLKAYYLYEED